MKDEAEESIPSVLIQVQIVREVLPQQKPNAQVLRWIAALPLCSSSNVRAICEDL